MTIHFEHTTLGQRVIFGSASASRNLVAELRRMQSHRPLVIASVQERALAEAVCGELSGMAWFDDVRQHVPVANAESARSAAAAHGADVLITVGGGSTTGLAKAVALTSALPIIAIPTTYAGSEATNVWGLTEERTKRTGTDDRVLPTTVIYDATLTLSLPVKLSIASGLNALAHCVDSLWAPKSDPINRALALEGARALNLAMRAITMDPEGLDGREQALYGCYLAAVAFASAGSGLHHKICHVLGGTFDLPHAETHAVILPHVLRLNGPAVPDLDERLTAALSGSRAPGRTAIDALLALNDEVGAPTGLGDYGFATADIPEAVDRILTAAADLSNPVPLTAANITSVLTNALTGAPFSVSSPTGARA